MPTAKEYLEMLYQQDPQLFSEPLKVSILAEPDLQFMEQQIGYRLPKQFEAFLDNLSTSSMTMFITFCGELASLYKTFSREKNGYVLNQSYTYIYCRLVLERHERELRRRLSEMLLSGMNCQKHG